MRPFQGKVVRWCRILSINSMGLCQDQNLVNQFAADLCELMMKSTILVKSPKMPPALYNSC